MQLRFLLTLAAALLAFACGGGEPAETPPSAAANENQDDQYFMPEGDYAASHILIAYQGALRAAETVTRTREEAEEKARQLLTRLSQEPQLFESVAEMESDGPSANNGGNLGIWNKGAMTPAFDKAVEGLAVGEITPDPVETPFGFHLIRRNPIDKVKHYAVLSFIIPFKGAPGLPAAVTRDKEAARALAEKIAPDVTPENFEEMAAEHSELVQLPLRPFVVKENDPLPPGLLPLIEGLPYGGVGGPLALDPGFVFVKRQKVRRLAGAHILIAYQGAASAGANVTRSKEEARETARSLTEALRQDPADFAETAKAHSDGPTGAAGGDLGHWFEGVMAPEFDAAITDLSVGEITAEPVETKFGFHIIQRREVE